MLRICRAHTADIQRLCGRSPEAADGLHLPVDGGGAAAGGGFDAACEGGGAGADESQAGGDAVAFGGDWRIAVEFLAAGS